MAEKLTDVELSSIQLHEPRPRNLSTASTGNYVTQVDDVETAMGMVHIQVHGDRNKPAILTYHDIGLNGLTCFQGFFSGEDMQPILRYFCLYHVTAPGQQEGALPLPQGYQYPSMDHLAEMLLPVMQFYGLKRFIGFGVGAGANILARFALAHPDKVEALVLLNCSSSKSSWSEWGYQKVNSWYLKSGQLSAQVEEYLLWHWFGSKTVANNHDLTTVYADYIKSINPQNLAHFMQSYIKRTDLGLVRETDPAKKAHVKNFQCPVMLVGGDSSPHLDQVVYMNSRLDPTNSTWMKFDCGGMILEEAPDKMVEAFRLFLQGMGYVPTLSQTRIVAEHEAARRASMISGTDSRTSDFQKRRVSQPVNTTPTNC